MQRLFVEVSPDDPDRVRLDARQARHLRARRLTRGDRLHAIVAPGVERIAILERIDDRGALLRLDAIVPDAGRDVSSPRVLALSLADLPRMDLIVEKATELGVTTIQPFRAARSQMRDVSSPRFARWQRIARAASEQCGRTVPPVIAECIDLPTLCASFPAGDRRVVLDPTGASVWRPRTRKGQGLILIIGPEGGFSADELDLLVQHGAERASLGRRILRFETAAIAALAIADADAHRLHAGEMELSEEPGTRS